MGPLDHLRKHNLLKMWSEFHIERDATYIAPESMDIQEIYNRFE